MDFRKYFNSHHVYLHPYKVVQMVNTGAIQETQVHILDQEDLLEEGRASHSSILAWRTPWTEEPGRL